MHPVINWLRGSLLVELQGAAPAAFLNACGREGIPFRGLRCVDPCTLRLTLWRRDRDRAAALAEKSQCSLNVLEERGAATLLGRAKRRYGLLAGLLLCCGALLYSSLFIWEIDVQGNSAARETEILDALSRAGVCIGSYWPDFSNESIKCEVLLRVPELSWLSVNVRGSRATVLVRERVQPPALYRENVPVRIEAGKAGLIQEMQVLQGLPASARGKTVLPGELLVSETMPSSFEKALPRRVHAKARVMARTWYSLSAAAPLERQVKEYTGRERRGLGLVLGTRRINLYNIADNSRNSDRKYDKVEQIYPLAIPGLFRAPLALEIQRQREYTLRALPEAAELLRASLEEGLRRRLLREIGDEGEICTEHFSAQEKDGMLYVTLQAECLEDIARERPCPEETGDTKEIGEGDTSQVWKEAWQ